MKTDAVYCHRCNANVTVANSSVDSKINSTDTALRDKTEQKEKTYFMNKKYYIMSIIFGFLFAYISFTASYITADTNIGLSILLFFASLIIIIYLTIVILILIYRMWSSIQDGHARTTPAKAIGFLFIPLFNCYWLFQVFWGYVKDYNQYISRHSINAPVHPEGLFLIYPITVIAAMLMPTPFLWPLLLISPIILIIITPKICDGINSISSPTATITKSSFKVHPKNIKTIAVAAASVIVLVTLFVIFLPRPSFSLAVTPMPDTLEPGDEIIIRAEIENSGRKAGLYSLTLMIDGSETEVREINVRSGEKESIHFTLTDTLPPGVYQIDLNEWSCEIKVLKPAEFHIENFVLNPNPVQIGEITTVSATILNSGEVSGIYTLSLAIDDETIMTKDIELSSSTTELFSMTLQKDEPGSYFVKLNEHKNTLRVLKPANITVTSLSLNPSSIRPGQSSTVSIAVGNSGDVEGTHTVNLQINGKIEHSKTVTVRGNSTEDVSFSISRSSPGRYTVTSGGINKTLTVIQIERPANGTIITRKLPSGEGQLAITNGRSQDALVILTAANSPGNTLLAVYVRGNSSVTLSNISDRTYDVYFSLGDDWDKTSSQFTRNTSYLKFRDSLKFTTTSMQYTRYEITLHAVTGGTAATDRVSPGQFPSSR